MNQPNIAVIIPAYNSAKTITTAVRSVLADEGVVREVIVYDDASTDETSRVVNEIRGPKVQLLRGTKNHGPGFARDVAMSEVSAPWIAFLDADDTCKPGRLEVLLSAAVATGADVVFDDALVCRDTARGLVGVDRVHGKHAFGARGDQPCVFSAERYISAPRLLIHPLVRTATIRESGLRHSSRRFGEDAEFYLRLAYVGARFCYVPQALYLYRITKGSLTARAQDHSLMRKCLEDCATWPEWGQNAKAAFAKKIIALTRQEAAYAVVDAARAGRALTAVQLALSNPAATAVLMRKCWGRVRRYGRALMPAMSDRK